MDFFLPDYDICVEYDGIQHYHNTGFFGSLEDQQNLDRRKEKYLQQNGIKLVRFRYDEKLTKELVFERIMECINKE